MVDDEGRAVLGKNVFKESVEKYIPVDFPKRLIIIPGRGTDETMICALVPAVKKVIREPVLQQAQRLNGPDDIRNGDAFAEILEQPVAE